MKRRRYIKRAKPTEPLNKLAQTPLNEPQCATARIEPPRRTPYDRIKELEQVLSDVQRRRSYALNEVYQCDMAIAEANVKLDRQLRLLKADLGIVQ